MKEFFCHYCQNHKKIELCASEKVKGKRTLRMCKTCKERVEKAKKTNKNLDAVVGTYPSGKPKLQKHQNNSKENHTKKGYKKGTAFNNNRFQ